MARTISQIVGLMEAAHAAEPSLSPLNNTSATARWRLIYYVVATVIFGFEVLMDRLKAEVEEIRDASIPGTVEWYRLKAFDWQNGHAVVLVSGRPGYAVDDPASRIVARSAVLELPTGGLIVKVAKASGGVLSALNSTELASIVGYYREIHFAGTPVAVLSQNADVIKITGTVYHDGTLATSDVAAAIDVALKAYLAGRPFNGRVRYAEILAVLMAVAGVSDISGMAVLVDAGGGFLPIGREHQPQSGWYILDTASSTFMNITWVADVQL
jgi:hypothetical protein